MTKYIHRTMAAALNEQHALQLLELAAQQLANRLPALELMNRAEAALAQLPRRDQRRLRAHFFKLVKLAQ